jgi:uracil-DNA glycosylase
MAQERDAAVRALVRRIRRKTRRRVPDIDPCGPGATARVLMLLSDPGEGGALRTGYLSPMRNTDPTARNQARLMAEAGLSPDVCVFWNGIPWDLEGRKPTAADKERGAAYLVEMVNRLPNRRAVVAAGRVAQDVCARAGIAFIPVPHPSNRGLSGGVRGARRAREAEHRRGLKRAAQLAA